MITLEDEAQAGIISDDRAKYDRLTERERTVLGYIARGFTAPEIGTKMSISAKTVDTYKQRIGLKIFLHHRSEFVAFALRIGLLS